MSVQGSVVQLVTSSSPKAASFYNGLAPILGLDKRSLALWRILLGLVSLGDLVNRICDLHAHYTDSGIYSRQDIVSHHSSNFYFVVHFTNGSWLFQACLFLFHMACALLYAVGYRTRLNNFLTWFLLVSLQSFSPFVGHAGDVYQRVLLFWSMFLPVDEVWSVDALLQEWDSRQTKKKKAQKTEPSDYTYLSMASVGMVAHLFYCYSISTYHKTGPEWRIDGTATFFALQLDFFALPLAKIMREFPSWILVFLTKGTLWWEFWGPFFFVSPIKTQYLRLVGVLGFMAMHFGFGTCLRLGQFFFITTVNFTAFLPPLFWDYFFRFIKTPERSNIKLYYNTRSYFSVSVAKFLHFFLLKEVQVEPITSKADDGQLGVGMDVESAQPSAEWLVCVTNEGKQLYGGSAFAHCCKEALLLTGIGLTLEKLPSLTIHLSRCFDFSFQETSWWVLPPKKERVPPLKQTPDRKLFYLSLQILKKLAVQIFLFWMIYLVFCWNMGNIGHSGWPLESENRWLMWTSRMDQQWNMFSPSPPKASFFYTMPGELVNTKQVELFRDGGIFNWQYNMEVNWDPPSDWKASFRSHRWFKFFENGFNQANSDHLRLSFGRFLCREYNSRYPVGEQVFTYQVYYNQLNVDAEGVKTVGTKQLLWSHRCFDSRPTLPEDTATNEQHFIANGALQRLDD